MDKPTDADQKVSAHRLIHLKAGIPGNDLVPPTFKLNADGTVVHTTAPRSFC